MSNNLPHLTKSKYISGLRCLRKLWFDVNDHGPFTDAVPGSAMDVHGGMLFSCCILHFQDLRVSDDELTPATIADGRLVVLTPEAVDLSLRANVKITEKSFSEYGMTRWQKLWGRIA